MSTIASPRPSIALSSRRGSASTDTTVTSTSNKPGPTAAERGSLRRNRAALRDYYNLKPASVQGDDPPTPTLDAEQESELDKPGFDPTSYVQNLLAQEGLEGVLRVEAGLVSDIRSLDGEKKALVYDNYSKLIAATDTIRSMREKMDPMTPTTSTLTPAIGHIAETASTLTAELNKSAGDRSAAAYMQNSPSKHALLRWVVDAPIRLAALMHSGKTDEAQHEWQRVQSVLERWRTVKGADNIRKRCQDALDQEAPS